MLRISKWEYFLHEKTSQGMFHVSNCRVNSEILLYNNNSNVYLSANETIQKIANNK